MVLLIGLVGDLQDRIARLGAVPDAEQRTAPLAEQLRVAAAELDVARRGRREADSRLARAEREGVLLQERLARLRLRHRLRTRCRR